MNSEPATMQQDKGKQESGATPDSKSKATCNDCKPEYLTLNPAFQPDTENPCPCCQQMSLETALQVMPRRTLTLVHCKNPVCENYAMTMTLKQAKASECDETS